jgi:chemotaxis protein MotB
MRSMMRKFSTVLILAGFGIALTSLTGCADGDLRLQNRTQADRIDQLSGQLQAAQLELEGAKKRLATLEQGSGAEMEALRQENANLKKNLSDREDLIKKMQGQLTGGGLLPVELSTALEDFAKGNPELIDYDSARGMVKFKTDLLFDKGSDNVSATAQAALKTLTGILNGDQAKQFDIKVAGHTDDIPIKKAETRNLHPTNWDLSVDRALAVLKLMEADGIVPVRLSACGYGEYRPIAPNAPNKGGNAQNRRVEIYIVPKGA